MTSPLIAAGGPQIAKYALVFHAPGPDQRRCLDVYADRVLPLLRRVPVLA